MKQINDEISMKDLVNVLNKLCEKIEENSDCLNGLAHTIGEFDQEFYKFRKDLYTVFREKE